MKPVGEDLSTTPEVLEENSNNISIGFRQYSSDYTLSSFKSEKNNQSLCSDTMKQSWKTWIIHV